MNDDNLGFYPPTLILSHNGFSLMALRVNKAVFETSGSLHLWSISCGSHLYMMK